MKASLSLKRLPPWSVMHSIFQFPRHHQLIMTKTVIAILKQNKLKQRGNITWSEFYLFCIPAHMLEDSMSFFGRHRGVRVNPYGARLIPCDPDPTPQPGPNTLSAWRNPAQRRLELVTSRITGERRCRWTIHAGRTIGHKIEN